MAIEIVNWNIIKNPLNWGIVLLMLALAALLGHLLLSYAGIEPTTATSGQPSTVGGAPASQS